MKRRILILALLCALVVPLIGAQASTPYRTFTLGVNKDLVETQTAYEPVRSMIRFGEEMPDPRPAVDGAGENHGAGVG